MLSRVADSLYWMSRYLERAENTARLLDVSLNQSLDQTSGPSGQHWTRLLETLQPKRLSDERSAYALTESLTFDASNNASVAARISAARENARQVREQISSEMWEQLNRLYLMVRQTTMDEIWNAEPHAFFAAVKDGAHLFQGITDATMSHGEGWYFIQLGRFIERAAGTARLLDVHFRAFAASNDHAEAVNYFEWVGLLKSCTAFEAYCKVYTADVKPDYVAEYLLLNAEFPRSIRFCAASIQAALQGIDQHTSQRSAARLERLAGRLRAALDYGQLDEIMNDNVYVYLESIQRQCDQIHAAVYQTYIAYPINAAVVQAALLSEQQQQQ